MSEEKNNSATETSVEAINPRDRILSQKDFPEILPFKRTKIKQLIDANQLPVVRVGKDYITTFDILQNWIKDNIGSEIYY